MTPSLLLALTSAADDVVCAVAADRLDAVAHLVGPLALLLSLGARGPHPYARERCVWMLADVIGELRAFGAREGAEPEVLS